MKKILFILSICFFSFISCKKSNIPFTYKVINCYQNDDDYLFLTVECDFAHAKKDYWIYKDGSSELEVEETYVKGKTFLSEKSIIGERNGWSGSWGYNPRYPDFLYVTQKEKVQLEIKIDMLKSKNVPIKNVEFEIYLFEADADEDTGKVSFESILQQPERKIKISVPYAEVLYEHTHLTEFDMPENMISLGTYSMTEPWYAGSEVGGDLTVKVDILKKSKDEIEFSIYKDFSRFPILNVDKIIARRKRYFYEFTFVDNWGNVVSGHLTFGNKTLSLLMECEKPDEVGKNNAGRMYGEPHRLWKDKIENLADAVKYDDIDSCRKLLENGANPNQTISYKDENLSLLYYSVETGKIEIAKLLLEYGADVNWTYAESWTPFVLAMYREEEELLQIMLEHDVDYTRTTINELSYFSFCLGYKRYKSIDTLLKNEGFRNYLLSYKYIWIAFVYSWDPIEVPKIIENLFGKDFIVPDDNSVLIYAIEERDPDCLKYFVEHGVDPTKEYYDERFDRMITPYKKAVNEKFLMGMYHGGDVLEINNKSTVKKIDEIINYLEDLSLE